jgi:hypothetical protein
MSYLGASEDAILLGCRGCYTLGLLWMSYLGAAKDVILQLLHFVDLDINLVSEVPGLLYFLEKLLHVTCKIVQNITKWFVVVYFSADFCRLTRLLR